MSFGPAGPSQAAEAAEAAEEDASPAPAAGAAVDPQPGPSGVCMSAYMAENLVSSPITCQGNRIILSAWSIVFQNLFEIEGQEDVKFKLPTSQPEVLE